MSPPKATARGRLRLGGHRPEPARQGVRVPKAPHREEPAPCRPPAPSAGAPSPVALGPGPAPRTPGLWSVGTRDHERCALFPAPAAALPPGPVPSPDPAVATREGRPRGALCKEGSRRTVPPPSTPGDDGQVCAKATARADPTRRHLAGDSLAEKPRGRRRREGAASLSRGRGPFSCHSRAPGRRASRRTAWNSRFRKSREKNRVTGVTSLGTKPRLCGRKLTKAGKRGPRCSVQRPRFCAHVSSSHGNTPTPGAPEAGAHRRPHGNGRPRKQIPAGAAGPRDPLGAGLRTGARAPRGEPVPGPMASGADQASPTAPPASPPGAR